QGLWEQPYAAPVGTHAAAADGEVAGRKEHPAADPQPVSSRSVPDKSLLGIAATLGLTNEVELLISQGADVNYKEGFQGMTALAQIASGRELRNDRKCAEVAKILIAYGADIEVVDGYGMTPL